MVSLFLIIFAISLFVVCFMMKVIGLFLLALVLGLRLNAQSPQTYMVSDFAEDELESVLDLCGKGGIEQVLHKSPFSSYGHYEWDPAFASKGDRSVARMVQKAQEAGVRLGLLIHEDAISLNDSYFAPRYFKQLRKTGPVQFYSNITAEQRDLVIYHTEELDQPSTLNLILVGKEMLSYGTMEPAGDMLFLHRCFRGIHGTKNVEHEKREEAYKIWDSPERYCAPEGALLDSVRNRLVQRIVAAGSPFTMLNGGYGQDLVNTSQRVQLVERWSHHDGSQPLMLGWIPVRVSDKRQASSTLEDLEWVLSKAAAFNAGFGLVIDRIALKRYGQLDKVMALVKAWNAVRDAGVLTEYQKEDLRDPYADWHLEPYGEEGYLLFPVHQSRGYRCVFQERGSHRETWQWKSDETSVVGLRIEVKGKGEIRQPMLATASDTLVFPCVVKVGEFLLCDFDGVARVTDADYHTLQEFPLERMLTLSEGESSVFFSCDVEGDKKLPEVSVRYFTREEPTLLRMNR